MFVIKDRVRERKYYKYSYDSWTRPNITSNNTMGFSNFACTASLNPTTAYQCFDGNISTYFNTGSNSSNPQNITFYSKNALNITQMTIYQYTAEQYYYSRNITIQGSENGEDWVDITTWERTSWVASFTIDMSSNTNYYNYYRVVVTNRSYYDGNNAYWILGEIECVGTQRIKNISTEEDYDIYEDVEKEVIKTPNTIERKYYKYIYNPWTQPVLSGNGTMGGTTAAASASNVHSSYDGQPWRAFNGADASSSGWANNNIAPPQWLMFYNPTAFMLQNFTVINRYHVWTTFTLQGSNDGVTFTDIETFTNSDTTYQSSWSKSISSANQKMYKYYRFYITETSSNSAADVLQVKLYGVVKSYTESTSSDYDFYEDITHTRVYKSF